jgi:hypothetical protein
MMFPLEGKDRQRFDQKFRIDKFAIRGTPNLQLESKDSPASQQQANP